jgi:hypothetical protein
VFFMSHHCKMIIKSANLNQPTFELVCGYSRSYENNWIENVPIDNKYIRLFELIIYEIVIVGLIYCNKQQKGGQSARLFLYSSEFHVIVPYAPSAYMALNLFCGKV